ncbi:hypothetical protein N665_0247s0028 [Sinapis alba]|nr:hypothetical protein N665_0247s0028 [Sinapis alba]
MREINVSLAAKASQELTFTQLNQLHAQLVVLNSLHRQSYWASRLIAYCTRLRAPPHYARLVFLSVAFPNVFVVNSMFRYFSQMDLPNDALRLYERRSRCGIMPDAFSYPVKLGLLMDPYVRNVVMDMYVKYESVDIARKLFDEITQRKVSDWNVMVSGYWRCGNKEEACKMFDMIPENEIDVVSWTVMITCFAKLKDLKSARWYFDRMPEKSASCSSRGDLSLAHSLVKLIGEKRVRLNCYVKTALLEMQAKCKDILSARRIFNELGAERNLVTWNAMISGYARMGDLSSTMQLFDAMPERSVVSWNSMIAGFAHNGQPALAIEFFKEMIDSGGFKPDEVTMISALSACGHVGNIELGDWIVDYIAKNQINLSLSGYRSLIFRHARCGNLREAKRVLEEPFRITRRRPENIRINKKFIGGSLFLFRWFIGSLWPFDVCLPFLRFMLTSVLST